MPDAETFSRLMAGLRTGEDAAAREVFERFAGRLIAMARGRFNRLLARKVDPEDVVQSAFKSFFLRYRAGQFELGSWKEVWGLLTVITLRKCVNRLEYFRAGGEIQAKWLETLSKRTAAFAAKVPRAAAPEKT